MTTNRRVNRLLNLKFPITRENFFITLVLLLTVIIYASTLAPSVVYIDSGELAAVQSVLGIAHPTGYPLFTILGHLFSRCPVPQSNILKSNLLSLIWCVLGVFIFLKTLILGIQHIASVKPRQKIKKRPHAHEKPNGRADTIISFYPKIIACIAGSISLAFSRTYWLQATSVEVYSLQLAIITLVLYLLIRIYLAEQPSFRDWMWVTVALALGFTNHMTIILILPGTAYLFFLKEGFRRHIWKRLFLLGCVFTIVAGLIYLYLPLRAAGRPTLNWGNPVNWENLVRHASGKQYRVWMFSSSQVAMNNLNTFLKNFPSEFTWIGLIFGVLGIYSSFIRNTRFAVFMLVTFISTVFYAINYDIHDLDAYFLLAYIVFAMWIAFGVHWIVGFVQKQNWRWIITGIIVLTSVWEVTQNYSKADQSDVYIFEDYTKQALQSLPVDGVLMSYQWDYLISPAYYFQFVENFRKDVAIIDKELLRRSWYFDQMKNNYPVVMQNVEIEIASFLKALGPFEHGGDYNASILEQRYRRLISRLIETNMKDRSVFIAPELVEGEFRRGELILPPGLQIVPDLFFFRVVASNEYVPLNDFENFNLSIRFSRKSNRYSDMIKNFVSKMLAWRALYEIQHGQMENAKILKKTINQHFPDFQPPEALRNL